MSVYALSTRALAPSLGAAFVCRILSCRNVSLCWCVVCVRKRRIYFTPLSLVTAHSTRHGAAHPHGTRRSRYVAGRSCELQRHAGRGVQLVCRARGHACGGQDLLTDPFFSGPRGPTHTSHTDTHTLITMCVSALCVCATWSLTCGAHAFQN